MRTGVIVSYNSVVRFGYIKDENQQKIRFYNEDEHLNLKRLDVVKFSIGFVGKSLMAIDVAQVHDQKGCVLSLSNLVN